MTDETFVSLEKLLDGYFETDLADLPGELRQRVERDFYVKWDGLSPEDRRGFAAAWDHNHNPANDQLREDTDLILKRKQFLKNDIAIRKSKSTPTDDKHDPQQENVETRQAELYELAGQERIGLDERSRLNIFARMAADRYGEYPDNTRVKVCKRINRMKRALDITSWIGWKELSRKEVFAEVKAAEDWLNGSRKAPTTGNEDVINEFPLTWNDRDLQIEQELFSNKDTDDPTQETHPPKGGAPTSTITEVITHVYKELIRTKNTILVEPGNIRMFLKHLKKCATDKKANDPEKANDSEYVIERIKEVRNVEGDCRIIIHPWTKAEKMKVASTGKNIEYNKGTVSRILAELRNKK